MGDSMSTIINATTTNGVVIQPDNSGSLVLQTNNGTTALTIDTSQNATFAGTIAMGSSFLRNRIINGDMRIDQRNAGASVTPANLVYALDRWRTETTGGGIYSVQRSTVAPSNFNNSLLVTVTTADASIASTDYYDVQQFIEGFNVADLAWGTANAQAITISFWVRSSVTGTFAGGIQNGAANRSYVFTYTISAANTWEKQTITIAGDTSGTWLTDNGRGLCLTFDLGNGSSYQTTAGSWVASYATGTSSSVKLISTVSATWYITGVQLEVGTSATPFERRLYNQELANCQRYYVQYFGTSVYEFSPSYLNGFNTTNAYGWIQVPVPMRASPSVSASTFLINDEVAARAGTSLAIYAVGQSNKLVSVLAQAASGISSSRAYNLIANNSTSAYIQISSEL
jgi:hypothetical protein